MTKKINLEGKILGDLQRPQPGHHQQRNAKYQQGQQETHLNKIEEAIIPGAINHQTSGFQGVMKEQLAPTAIITAKVRAEI